MDSRLAESNDRGVSWIDRSIVEDAANDATTDQFQPEVAAGPGGAVAVVFYDRRGTCPRDPSVQPANVGAANTCVDVSLQAYKETGQTTPAAKVGANTRISSAAYDPAQPVQHVDGIGQQACSAHRDPCTEVFLGDYFGLAVSTQNVYALFASTHYPSRVPADEGGRVYYQQQVLATVPRSGFGTGY